MSSGPDEDDRGANDQSYCSNCGEELTDDSQFCPNCGAPVGDRPPPDNPAHGQETGEQPAQAIGDAGGEALLSDALNYPKNRDGALTNPLAIGAVLNLFTGVPILGLIPFVFIVGYGADVFRGVMEGDPEPPKFRQWSRLFVDGLKGGIILLAYFFVPLVILLGSFAAALPSQTQFGYTASPDFGTLFAGIFISLPLFLVAGYVAPAAFAGFARSGKISSGFAVSTLIQATFDGKYFIGWIKAFIVYILYFVMLVFLFAFALIPLLGILVLFITVPILQFYIPVAMAYVYGRSYAESLNIQAADTADEHGTAQSISGR